MQKHVLRHDIIMPYTAMLMMILFLRHAFLYHATCLLVPRRSVCFQCQKPSEEHAFWWWYYDHDAMTMFLNLLLYQRHIIAMTLLFYRVYYRDINIDEPKDIFLFLGTHRCRRAAFCCRHYRFLLFTMLPQNTPHIIIIYYYH